MIVRTAIMDEFITRTIIQDNVDTIVNLAAGLDTRPYQLELPSSLRWIEVDLPDILDYKESKLTGFSPNCRLERKKVDLVEIAARKKLFEQINLAARRALVITEGLLLYLSGEDVASLAEDLHSRENFRWWTLDIATPALLGWLLNNSFRRFAEGDIQMKFAPEGGPSLFMQFGWDAAESRLVSKESRRLKREMPGMWFYRLLATVAPRKQREVFVKMDSHFVLLKKRT